MSTANVNESDIRRLDLHQKFTNCEPEGKKLNLVYIQSDLTDGMYEPLDEIEDDGKYTLKTLKPDDHDIHTLQTQQNDDIYTLETTTGTEMVDIGDV